MILNDFIFWKLNILCRFEVYIYKIKYFFLKKQPHITTVASGIVFKIPFFFKRHTYNDGSKRGTVFIFKKKFSYLVVKVTTVGYTCHYNSFVTTIEKRHYK